MQILVTSTEAILKEVGPSYWKQVLDGFLSGFNHEDCEAQKYCTLLQYLPGCRSILPDDIRYALTIYYMPENICGLGRYM